MPHSGDRPRDDKYAVFRSDLERPPRLELAYRRRPLCMHPADLAAAADLLAQRPGWVITRPGFTVRSAAGQPPAGFWHLEVPYRMDLAMCSASSQRMPLVVMAVDSADLAACSADRAWTQ